MAKASKLLLEAQDRYKPRVEDRLTEVFATALTVDEELASEFIMATGISPTNTYDVRTQVRTAAGTRVDMQVRALLGESVQAVLWCEHKLNADFHPRQLQYPELLADLPGESNQLLEA